MKKILVVDDNPMVLETLTLILRSRNYEVLTASGGSTAVNIIRTQKPDAILLDLSFPDDFGNVPWDGFRIMEWLKRLDDTAKTPIFIISSSDPAKYVARAQELGAVGFFRKPVAHDELLATLDRTLSNEPVSTT